MDFYELAAKLIQICQGSIYAQSDENQDVLSYLERKGLIRRRGRFDINHSCTAKGDSLVRGFEGLKDIAEYLEKKHNTPIQLDVTYPVSLNTMSDEEKRKAPTVDQSTHIHGNNTGAVVAHSRLDASPIIINSSVTELLTKIEQALQEETSLSNEERQDALIDVETLRSQLQRSKPDTTLLDRILSRLGDIASIGSLIAALSGMF